MIDRLSKSILDDIRQRREADDLVLAHVDLVTVLLHTVLGALEDVDLLRGPARDDVMHVGVLEQIEILPDLRQPPDVDDLAAGVEHASLRRGRLVVLGLVG